MGIKNFSNQSQTIVGAAVVLGLMSLVSRLIGILRDRVFANQFGAGDILDASYAAFRIPDFIYNLIIVGALSAGWVLSRLPVHRVVTLAIGMWTSATR